MNILELIGENLEGAVVHAALVRSYECADDPEVLRALEVVIEYHSTPEQWKEFKAQEANEYED